MSAYYCLKRSTKRISLKKGAAHHQPTSNTPPIIPMRSILYILTSPDTNHIVDFNLPNHNIILIYLTDDLPILAPSQCLSIKPLPKNIISKNTQERAFSFLKTIKEFKRSVTYVVCTGNELKYAICGFDLTFAVVSSERPSFVVKCLKKLCVPILEMPRRVNWRVLGEIIFSVKEINSKFLRKHAKDPV